MSEIVVGLDLSPAGAAALRWAADQARRTRLPLRAVHARAASLTGRSSSAPTARSRSRTSHSCRRDTVTGSSPPGIELNPEIGLAARAVPR